ncbi:MAG: hypothetical protein Q8916_13585 [Bacteroidota bacterium]|nr:hypothetical protein [Bacteroidota bacterium]MDP4231425.1 hypothetical protein [Bacteroidota bacterium]MDP4236328.1 hypothetical protein [Bacteroidota bacterium]
MTFISPKTGLSHNRHEVARKHFPGNILATCIGIASLTAPFIYNWFQTLGIESVPVRIVLIAVLVISVPAMVLYVITLFRAPKIILQKEAKEESEVKTVTAGLEAIKEHELKEEKVIGRLEDVVKENTKDRKLKDEKEEDRWDLLDERLRVQEEAGKRNIELNEEILAQNIKDSKTEHELNEKIAKK